MIIKNDIYKPSYIADSTNIPISTIYRWLSGKNLKNFVNFIIFLEFLGYNASDFAHKYRGD